MKNKSKILIAVAAVTAAIAVVAAIIWFSMPSEQRNMMMFMMTDGPSYENHAEYQVIEPNDTPPVPTSFVPVVAATTDDDYNSNITVMTRLVQNEASKMVKMAAVQPNGAVDYPGWRLIADEGFEEGVNTFGPSPLSYLTTGAAANLHTQVLRAAEVLNVELESARVEVLNKFHWENMLSAEGAGFLGETHANIIIESSASEEDVQKLTEIALNSWTAGEAFRNETTIEPALVVNGERWENHRAVPGVTLSDESHVAGRKISHITDGPMKSDYFEQVDEEDRDMSFEAISNLVFEILAVSESAEDPERPYLKKVTVSFNTTKSETWELYADELTGAEGSPAAPTSLEYLTAGTALCLTSQLTLVSAMMDLDYRDFRVEQQIDYREEAVNSASMVGYTDTVHTSVIVDSDESEKRLNQFFQKSLALCFAGEAFNGATDMHVDCYLNGELLE